MHQVAAKRTDLPPDWAEQQSRQEALLPSNPLTKALHYALERREGLSVYLQDPQVPTDTLAAGADAGSPSGERSRPRQHRAL